MSTDVEINTKVKLDFEQRARAVTLESCVGDDEYATAAEIIFLRDSNAALLTACRRAKKLLEPELEKEPDRTIFWELVNAIAKAEGKP